MIDDKSIRLNIANERKKMGLSQRAMGEMIGLTRIAYRNLENGNTRIINPMLDKIAEITGVCTEKLLFGYVPDKQLSLDHAKIVARQKEIEANRIKEFEETIATLNRELEHMKRDSDNMQEIIRTKDMIIKMNEKMVNKIFDDKDSKRKKK